MADEDYNDYDGGDVGYVRIFGLWSTFAANQVFH